jgi:hypothetical protein
VGGKGQGGDGGALLEQRAPAGQGVQNGRAGGPAAVGAEAIGPGGIEGHDHDIGLVDAEGRPFPGDPREGSAARQQMEGQDRRGCGGDRARKPRPAAGRGGGVLFFHGGSYLVFSRAS